MTKKDAFDNFDAFDLVSLDAFDKVELDPEDKLLFSKELKTVVREEIGKLPIDKLITTITEKALSQLEKPKDWAAEIKESQKELRNAIEESKKEKEEIVEKLKDKYAELRNDLLNRPQYQFGGFAPPDTIGHSGQFLTNNGAGVFSWAAGGSSGISIGNAVTGGSAYSVLFVNASGNLAQNNSQFNFLDDPSNSQLTVDSTIYDPYSATGFWGTTALGLKLTNKSAAAIGNKAGLSFYFNDANGSLFKEAFIYATQTNVNIAFPSTDLVFSVYNAGISNDFLRIIGETNVLQVGSGLSGTDNTIRIRGFVHYGDLTFQDSTSTFIVNNVGAFVAGDDLVANLGAATTRWITTYSQHFVGTDLTLTTPLAVAYGGTGASSYTNGQLLIGNTSTGGLSVATLTGTTNQVNVTNAGGTITLSTPQNINSTATAQFIAIGLGTAGGTSQYIKTLAGTTTKCVANFTPGTRKSSGGQAGDFETDTDDIYYTITTGTSRKTLVLTDGLILTSGRVPIASTNGRLITDAGLAYASSTLTVTNIAATNISGNMTFAEGINAVLGTTTGTKIGTATSQKLGFFNSTPIIQPVATTDLGTVLSNLGLRAAGTAYPITTSGAVVHTASSGGTTDGQIWNDTTQKSAAVYEAGVKQMLSAVLFTQTADKSVTNTLTETTIFGTGVGTLTLPANFFVAGKTVRLTMSGTYSTVAVTGDTITIKVKYGTTVLASKATTSLLAGASGLYWTSSIDITCRTTGATGTVMTSGQVQYEITTAGGVALDELNNGAATTTIDTTASNALDVTVTHSAANASNTVTSIVSTVQVLN